MDRRTALQTEEIHQLVAEAREALADLPLTDPELRELAIEYRQERRPDTAQFVGWLRGLALRKRLP